MILPLSPEPLTNLISIPFSSANFLASGDIRILSVDSLLKDACFISNFGSSTIGSGSSFATGSGSSFATGSGSSSTTGSGSSSTTGSGSSFTTLLPLIIDEISSPFDPMTAIILSTGAVEPSSIPM